MTLHERLLSSIKQHFHTIIACDNLKRPFCATTKFVAVKLIAKYLLCYSSFIIVGLYVAAQCIMHMGLSFAALGHLTLSHVFGPSGSFGFPIVYKVPSLVMLGHNMDSHQLQQQPVYCCGCDLMTEKRS